MVSRFQEHSRAIHQRLKDSTSRAVSGAKDHARRIGEGTRRFSSRLHNRIPPVRLEPVRDAFTQMTLRQFVSIALIVFCVFSLSSIMTYFFAHPAAVQELVVNAKQFGPLILISLIVLEALVLPLPASLAGISAGYLFGQYWGMLYAWIGTSIAVVIAFSLAKKFGQPLVKRMLAPYIYDFYSDLFRKYPYVMGLIYAVPIFPIVTLSFLVGMSSLSLLQFMLFVYPALLINMFILTFLGQNIATFGLENAYVLIGLAVLFLCTALLAIFTFRKAQKARDASLKKETTGK